MSRNEQITLACVQALEKGLIPVSSGWDQEKACALYDTIRARTKPLLPSGTRPDEVYDVIRDILTSLEDAEPKYVPKWAKEFLSWIMRRYNNLMWTPREAKYYKEMWFHASTKFP